MSKKELCLLVTSENDREFGHIKAHVRAVEDGAVVGYIFDFARKPYEYYEDFEISCQMDGRKPEPYGQECSYKPYRVDMNTAAKMNKTLNRISKKLTKMSDTMGYADTFAEYILRVAAAIGCKKFAVRKNHSLTILDAKSIRFEIAGMLNDLQDHFQKAA